MADLVDELRRLPVFSCLNLRQLRQLARYGRKRVFKPGMPVVRQGEMSGIGFFIVTEGEASVVVDGKEVGRLGPGDQFGELALISERARTATVTAEATLSCIEIRSWDFRRVVRSSPSASWKLLQHLADMLVDVEQRQSRGNR